jgi:ubiquinol-cytochrome c reductase cytochrome b subunit
MCHTINGSGMSIGPQLNGVAKRRSQDWVARHFADPAKVSPGSMMPPYRLSPQDLDNLTAYLFALPE